MKKIFFFTTASLSILSWIFFLFISFFLLFPAGSIKVINQYAITSYEINFSDLENSGNILNQNFKFYNLHIKHNDKSLLKVREMGLGILLRPQNFFQPLSITTLSIQDGYYNHSYFSKSNSSFSNFIDFNKNSSLSFKNFEFRRNNSSVKINGDLFGEFPSSLNGQLSFLHDNNLSTFAVNLTESIYRFSINLHSYEWFSLIPAYNISPFKDLAFKLNAVGEVQDNQSFIKGSFDYRELYFRSLNIKPNQGSFVFQLNQDIGSLILTKFLNPIVDEQHPIQINLTEKSIAFPRFSLSPEIVEVDTFKFKNLILENLFLSFNGKIPKYSGLIRD